MRAVVGTAILGIGGVVAILSIRKEPSQPPPPTLFFAGLPVSGSIADARRAGFLDCFGMDAVHMRCRRHGVHLMGYGPFEAAVDLEGSRGQGGFDQVILWHDRDNYAVYLITDAFEHAGWRSCYVGSDDRGDQIIYARAKARFRVSMDLSYYAKRRLRLIPDWNVRDRRCVPS